MQSVLHKYFDRGAIALEPDLLHTASAYDASTTTFFDVVFRWRDVLQGLRLGMTMLPLDPAEQVSAAPNRVWAHRTLPDKRRIEDGQKFRLRTDDPGRLPLPHPFLLSLHARLWAMIQSAGLAETIDRKRKRLDMACERTGNDNDGKGDGDHHDDAASDSRRKRVHRTKGRSGTGTVEKAKTPASGSIGISTSSSTSQARGAARNEIVGTAVTYGEGRRRSWRSSGSGSWGSGKGATGRVWLLKIWDEDLAFVPVGRSGLLVASFVTAFLLLGCAVKVKELCSLMAFYVSSSVLWLFVVI